MPVQLEAAPVVSIPTGSSAPTERERLAGARVGTVLKQKWHLDQLLGVGGMAAVYAATHRNKKRVAIKMLHAELSLDEAIRKRFRREGYIANSVGQRGAVAVDYDDVSDEGLAFLVMELLDGETIEQRWLRKGRVLSPHEVLSVVDQLLDTLVAAHAAGIIHRDLKPENMFLTRDGIVKVLDFGIARVRELSTPQTTLAGSAIGTPAFMSPEQARGRWQDVDGRSDLWAVGATLYTLLSGKFVHSAESAHETLALAATRPARSLAERRPDLHPSLIRLVDRALSYDKSARFPGAASMQQALRVTFGELQGGVSNAAGQLAIPDLQSIPASRAITLRNLTAPPHLRMSGQPTVAARRRQHQLLLGFAAVATFFLLALAWLRSRDEVSVVASPATAPARPMLAAPVAARGTGGPPPRASVGVPEPIEPKAIRVDDLPQEPVKAGPRRR
jgi:serine/threonine protein kinase